jgi:Fur family zinc uptake transcriptional regulator
MRKMRRPHRSKRKLRAFPRRGHDHGSCVEAAVREAAGVCARRKLRLTAIRRRVLELVWRSHKPAGAYAILAGLKRREKLAAPATVYRALDFLLDQGLVHRISSKSAYVGCADPGGSHAGQFLICGQCGAAAELDDNRIRKAVARGAGTLGFAVARQTVEVLGLCPRCRPKARPKARRKMLRRRG